MIVWHQLWVMGRPSPWTPDSAYVYSSEWIYRSSDGAVTWQSLTTPPGGLLFWLLPHPARARRLYARTWEALLRSDDDGLTWQAISAPGVVSGYNTPIGVRPNQPDYIFSGGFYSTDGGQSWQPSTLNR